LGGKGPESAGGLLAFKMRVVYNKASPCYGNKRRR
jgi:hypothetical protein